MRELSLDPNNHKAPTRYHEDYPKELEEDKNPQYHPRQAKGNENASVRFIGNATTIISYGGARIMTDPNFLHKGDHVHLGPGVTGTRLLDPAVELHELPHIDAVLLSHYHADHFDPKVEEDLRRDMPIITTEHAKKILATSLGENSFTEVTDLQPWDKCFINIQGKPGSGDVSATSQTPSIKLIAMPGKHVPPGPLSIANDILNAVPPTNGWMIELGQGPADNFQSGYRIYITGDTLLVDEIKDIPKRFEGQSIDLMLIHLGGTTIPSPKLPLLMVTMDAKQGVEMVKLIDPDITIPIHTDDYDVFLSPLKDFIEAAKNAGFGDSKIVTLDRGSEYSFTVRSTA